MIGGAEVVQDFLHGMGLGLGFGGFVFWVQGFGVQGSGLNV